MIYVKTDSLNTWIEASDITQIECFKGYSRVIGLTIRLKSGDSIQISPAGAEKFHGVGKAVRERKDLKKEWEDIQSVMKTSFEKLIQARKNNEGSFDFSSPDCLQWNN